MPPAVASWIRCRGWLLPAQKREGGEEAEVVADLASGMAQIWEGEGAGLVTQCVAGLSGRSLHVWLAGGNLREIIALRPGVEAWARAQGCVRVTIDGRRGWAKVLRGWGYVIGDGVLERRL